MNIQFKDRKKQLKEIKRVLNSKNFELIIIYGRRRIGKTELILKSTENIKRIYYLAVGEKDLERFQKTCALAFPAVSKLKADWEIIFDFLKDKVDVIIIDEFQNLIKSQKNILNIMQSIVDTALKKTKLKLFLLGSSVSIITSKVLDYKSPLYGRRTGSLNLKAVSFFELPYFFPKFNFEELMNIYGFADGIPYYLIMIDKKFWTWLTRELKSEISFLKDEMDFLMKYEFEDASTYKLILEAIANGKTKLSEIKDFIKLKRTDITPYLKNLIDVGMVKREVPITENIKSRRGRYYLADNFIKFWFKYIYPNLSLIEQGIFDIKDIKRDYSSYLGGVFENVVMQYLMTDNSFKFNKIGRWWHKDKEIDIVLLNETNKEATFIECKWQDKVNALKIASELSQKSKHVLWNNDSRKESYAVFAKSFAKKITEFEGKPVHCLDLTDLSKALKSKLVAD